MGPLKSRKLRKNAILGGVNLGKNSHRASSDLPNLLIFFPPILVESESSNCKILPDIRRILDHNDDGLVGPSRVSDT